MTNSRRRNNIRSRAIQINKIQIDFDKSYVCA